MRLYIIGYCYSKWDANNKGANISLKKMPSLMNQGDTRFNVGDVTTIRVVNMARLETKDLSVASVAALIRENKQQICSQEFMGQCEYALGQKLSVEAAVMNGIIHDCTRKPKIVNGAVKSGTEARFIFGTFRGKYVCYSPTKNRIFLRTPEEIDKLVASQGSPFLADCEEEIPLNELPVEIINEVKAEEAEAKRKAEEARRAASQTTQGGGVLYDPSQDLFSVPDENDYSYKPTVTKAAPKREKVYKDVQELLSEGADKIPEIDAEIYQSAKEAKQWVSSTALKRAIKITQPSIEGLRAPNTGIKVKTSTGGYKTPFSVEQSMYIGFENLKIIDPYLYVALQQIGKIAVRNDGKTEYGSIIDTAAVCQNSKGSFLVYNADFIATLSESDINFVLLHEVYHLIMGHLAGGAKKDRYIWNLATDLFVNGWIVKNYNLRTDGAEVVVQGETVRDNRSGESRTPGAKLRFAPGYLFHPGLDVSKTTPDRIYQEILEDLKNQVKQSQSGGQGQNQQGQGQNNQSQQGGGGQGQGQQQQGQGQNQQGQGGGGQGQGQQQGQGGGGQQQGQEQGQNGQQQGQGQGGGQGQDQQQQGQGNSPLEDYNQANGKRTLADTGSNVHYDENGNIESVDITYRGRVYNVPTSSLDLAETEEGLRQTADEKAAQAKQFGQKVQEASKMFGVGDSSPFLRQFGEVQEIKDISWEKFMAKHMNTLGKGDKSYRNPNRKMLALGHLAKGDTKAEPDSLKGVYICIDTSGSISDSELATVFGYLAGTMRRYGLQGNIVYWDTQVRAVGAFTNTKDMLRARKLASGGGGTDPNCVFEYFYSRECRPKPKLVMFMTDGYFGQVKKPTRKFGETIWVICSAKEDYKRFEAPFGKKAPLSLYD